MTYLIIVDILEDCCVDQGNKYLLYGFVNRNMSPDGYLYELTNYDDDEMRINHLWVRKRLIIAPDSTLL